MERYTAGKPYRKILDNFPQYKEEIDCLPRKYCEVIWAFPYVNGRYGMSKEDFFSMLVLLCLEVDQTKASGKSFKERACLRIRTELDEQKLKNRILYNPYKNLYFDKCYGDSDMPLGAWLDIRDENDETTALIRRPTEDAITF